MVNTIAAINTWEWGVELEPKIMSMSAFWISLISVMSLFVVAIIFIAGSKTVPAIILSVVFLLTTTGMIWGNINNSNAHNSNLESLTDHYNAELFFDSKYRDILFPREKTKSYNMGEDLTVNIVPHNDSVNEIDGIVRIRENNAVLLVPVDENSEFPEYVEYKK